MASKHSACRELTCKDHDGQGNIVWECQGWECQGWESQGCRYITADGTQGSQVWKQETDGTRMLVGTLKRQDERYWLESTTCKDCGAGDCADCRCPQTDADMDTAMFGYAKKLMDKARAPRDSAKVQEEIDAGERKMDKDNAAYDLQIALLETELNHKTVKTDGPMWDRLKDMAQKVSNMTKTRDPRQVQIEIQQTKERKERANVAWKLKRKLLETERDHLLEQETAATAAQVVPENEFCVRTYY